MRRISKSTQGLGWFLAAMLLFSSQAWGLDLDRAIARNEADSAQILSTLGRNKAPNRMTTPSTAKTVQIKMIKKKAKKRRS